MEEKKAPEKHVHKPVTDGKPIEKTKLEKALNLFLAEDASTISDSIMDDFIKPRMKQFGKESVLKIKAFVADSIKGCVDILIFGKKRSDVNTNNQYRKSEYTSYQSYYETNRPSGYITEGPDFGLKTIVIPSYGKAEEVLGDLIAITKRYGKAYVADYYQLTTIPTSKIDFSYGWTKLYNISISAYRDGYIIDLPKPGPVA